MSVKRYEANGSSSVFEDASGSLVEYEDYAALEQKLTDLAVQLANAESKCRELAVENVTLKADAPLGAIENGRAFADRLEAYPFECEGGNLNMCSDWQELRRCFEHLSEWAMHSQPETPATDAFLAEVRAQTIRDALDESSDYLDTDCVMDMLDISYEDAELRTSGAIELHDALVAVANQLRKGE